MADAESIVVVVVDEAVDDLNSKAGKAEGGGDLMLAGMGVGVLWTWGALLVVVGVLWACRGVEAAVRLVRCSLST